MGAGAVRSELRGPATLRWGGRWVPIGKWSRQEMSDRLRYGILTADLLWITAASILAHLLRHALGGRGAMFEQPLRFYVGSADAPPALCGLPSCNKNLEEFSPCCGLSTSVSQ